jgi:hypothetical protein
MKLINGLLNYSVPWTLPDMYLFTGNSTVKKNGANVMGRGAARQVRDSFSGIDQIFGYELTQLPGANLIWVVKDESADDASYLGWFKVKQNWYEPASIHLIQESTLQLWDQALKQSERTFHMNFPGVGNGQLAIEKVLPIVEQLPDNVLLYR